MIPDPSLKARYKRHLAKHTFTFHYIVPPGWENEALIELKHIAKPEILAVEYGGITFKDTIHCIPIIHETARIGIRLLMRITHFPCLSYSQLQKRLTMIPFELHLGLPETIQLKCQSKSSWLYSEKALYDQISEAVIHYFQFIHYSVQTQEHPSEQLTTPTLYILLNHNQLIVSLDLTGAPLYKRGISPLKTQAPLRENIVAAALSILPAKNYRMIYDPFCGSGTLLLEAYQFFMRPSGQSPRTFAYQFLPVGWCLTQLTPEKISYPPPSDGQFFIGQDKDERALTVFQKNLALCPFQTGISLIRGDSLTCLPRSIHQPILILTNPPYGRRLLNKKKAFLLIEKYLNTVLSIYHDVTIGIFFPENSILQKQASITKPFPHGGLDLFFYIIENSTL